MYLSSVAHLKKSVLPLISGALVTFCLVFFEKIFAENSKLFRLSSCGQCLSKRRHKTITVLLFFALNLNCKKTQVINGSQ